MKRRYVTVTNYFCTEIYRKCLSKCCRDDLSKLEYVTMCIKEAMRLHTTVPSVNRNLTKPLDVDGHTLPPGTTINLNLYGLHHNPEVWGENYNDYIPERHSAENRKNMDPYAFIPFSAGPR